jgi:hypothetical protein
MRREAWDCHACRKKAYPSERRALGVIEWIRVATDRQQIPERAYPCPYGNGWHLTSQKAKCK